MAQGGKIGDLRLQGRLAATAGFKEISLQLSDITCWDIGQLHWGTKLKPKSELEQASVNLQLLLNAF